MCNGYAVFHAKHSFMFSPKCKWCIGFTPQNKRTVEWLCHAYIR